MRIDWKSPEGMAQWLAVLCLVLLILLAGKPGFTNASQPVRGMNDPGIALQMARSVDEVDSILGPAPSADREAMRLKQYIDFALILTYAGIAVTIAMGVRRMRAVAIVLLLCVIAGAAFDWMENLAILRILALDLSATTQPSIDAIRLASIAKWNLIALAFLALSLLFFRSRRWYLRGVALLDLAAAALTAFAVSHNEWLAPAALLLSAGLVLSAATLKILTHESAA